MLADGRARGEVRNRIEIYMGIVRQAVAIGHAVPTIRAVPG